MAETYFGIGKLNFFVFLIVYFMVVGLVAALFDPSLVGVGKDPSLQDLEKKTAYPNIDIDGKDAKTEKDKQINPLGNLPQMADWDKGAFGKISELFGTGIGIFWAGLTFNIPDMPLLLRLFMVIPVVGAFMIVMLDMIIDLLKAVFKVPLAG